MYTILAGVSALATPAILKCTTYDLPEKFGKRSGALSNLLQPVCGFVLSKIFEDYSSGNFHIIQHSH